jgi:hypothetical protein
MIWIEVRCDLLCDGKSSCWSSSNRGPKRLAPSNSASDVALARSALLDEAKRDGWEITKRRGVICPGCRSK